MAIGAFAFASYHFGKWWVNLFSYFPLALHFEHGIIIDADIQRDALDKLKPQEGDDTSE